MSLDLSHEGIETPSTPKASIENSSTPQRSTISETAPFENVETRAKLDRVLQSDIGINTLLTRLKQSISSARDFSGFLKERATLEDKHASGINRLTRSTHDSLGKPENRQGSFAFNYREVGAIHDRMAKNSEDFAHNLLAMADELQELSLNCERGRKQWKHTGLEAEQRAQEAESAMDKARLRYFSSAEQYDRVRTGEGKGGKFGLKGPKSVQQQEDSLLSKTEGADQDYRTRVEAAQAQRRELLTMSRPQAVRELQNLIMECDSGLSMQLQKFAMLNEKLLLGNGLCISPLKGRDSGTSAASRSLREVIQSINNQRDFEEFVLGHNSKVGPPPAEIKYEKHPALAAPPVQHNQHPSMSTNTFNGPPQRTETGFGTFNGPPQRTDTGFGTPSGPPQRSDTGFGAFGGPPQRSDTGFGSMTGHPTQGGQTTGVTNPQMQPYQGAYPIAAHPPTTSTAPQLPHIGALSTGTANDLDGDRLRSPQERIPHESRNFSGPNQHRPGQPSLSGPPHVTASSPTINHQVTEGRSSIEPGSPPNQPRHMHGIPPQGPGQYSQGGRGLSLGQQNDFRQDARGASPPLQSNDFRPTGRGQPLSSTNDFRSDGRGPPQNYVQPGRLQDPPQNYAQTGRPQDPRGLPSQTGPSGPGFNGASNKVTSPGGSTAGPRGAPGRPSLPPLRPVFGVPLDELFRRDGAAVPTVVYQCIQAVDLYGLQTEGVYRISGSAQHIMELQALFDHDSSQVDFRNPSAFYNDIASVTTLLKHFLRDLPDPLLTSAQYSHFIQAAKTEDDILRRDSLHAIINSLPDPNYATLRTLTLHLNRITQNSATNRMTASNLAIVFGPTLMGGHGSGLSGGVQDAGWQARVVETILNNTMQIFDDDD